MSSLKRHAAIGAYAKTAIELASPRQLEADLLLNGAAKLRAVYDSWERDRSQLEATILYNRRLWIVFIDAVMRDDNRLPVQVRQNILNIGIFVIAEIFSLMTKPKPEHLLNIISINRRIAAGLGGKKDQPAAQAA
jgi:flagellar biosynthesis activator protein FlaF